MFASVTRRWKPSRQRARARLLCHALENRDVPSTYNVTNLNDNGAGSLRVAIVSANFNPGPDTITFGVTGTVTLTTGELDITGPLTISGPGSSNLTVSGNNASRVFNTSGAPASSLIEFDGITVTKGVTTVAQPGKSAGAGVYVGDESLTLVNSVITGNTTIAYGPGYGGGIYVQSATGSLNLQGCTVSNNVAGLYVGTFIVGIGGGIALGHASNVTISGSIIAGNSAHRGGGIGFLSGGSLLLQNSTVSGNSAVSSDGFAGTGGGLYFNGVVGPGGLTIRNSTIAANTADSGGGIFLDSSGQLTVQNSTITQNLNWGIYRYLAAPQGSVSLESSIVAGNTSYQGSSSVPADMVGNFTVSEKTSVIGLVHPGVILTDLGGNLPLGTDAMLGPLANNGGPTQTIALLPGSPCNDKGSNPAGLTTDQRGPGYPRVLAGTPDMGATETTNLTVSNTNDAGPQSLRQAILDANAFAGANTITFDPTYFSSPKTITLTSGVLSITDAVTITGPGANNAIVSGNGLNTVFDTAPAPTGATVSISGLTITGGKATSYGGGIMVGDESLTLTNCTVTANSANQGGGGINVQSSSGSLNLQNCTISNNVVTGAAYCGGGINLQSASSVTISSSIISGNTAGASGGGIYFFSGGSLLLSGSTLSGNKATNGFGGALYFFGSVGAGGLSATNCTISGNTAGNNGGGIGVRNLTGSFAVQNSTVEANVSTGGSGGGIANFNSSIGNVTIESSVVSGNMAVTGPDVFSSDAVKVKTSAIGSAVGFAISDQGGNLPFQPFANLFLGPLTNNGGPTQTCLPAYNSPLVGHGSNPASAFYDQRGIGFPRGLAGQIDIGAVQVNDLVVHNANDTGAGSLRQAITNANSLTGEDSITFDPAFFNVPRTINLTSGELAITDAVTITGPGATLATVSGGGVSRVFNTTQALTGSDINISGITITGGHATISGGGILDYDEAVSLTNCVLTNNVAGSGSGGAVEVHFPSGSLYLENCKLTNNSALQGGSGGAIEAAGGKVTIDSCVFSNNSASAVGGAATFYAGAQALIIDSTISGNTASAGGGLYFSNCSSMHVTSSTVSANSAISGSGGGIEIMGSQNANGSNFFNCTISGNSCQQFGGGIAGIGLASPLILRNSILTANSAGGIAGGGISSDITGTSTISIVSTVVSGNFNVNAPDISSPNTVNVNWSAIGSLKGFTLTGANNLPIGANLKLGPLANNGGPTFTHMPSPDSPLIDQGSNPENLATDQRGMARFVGNNVDIGSVEFQAQPSHVQTVIVNGGNVQRSRVTSISVTFDSHVTLPAAPATAFQLQRQSDGKLPALTAAVDDSGAGTMVTLTFTGSNAVDFGSLADGRYTLTISKDSINGGNFDGDSIAPGNNDFVLIGAPGTAPNLYRLFGDADGNGLVDGVDFGAFRTAFNTNSGTFDFDGSGIVDGTDFGQFRSRFGVAM